MKQLRRIAGRGLVLLGVLWAAPLLTGCLTKEPVYQTPPPDVPNPTANIGTSDKFRIGDQVMVSFSTALGSDTLLKPHSEAIKDDGTITPPFVGSVVATGKTPGDLQKELQDKYDHLYNHITVTVTSADRFYYVSGEVRKSGPEPYLGQTDIVKAISAAGDFTDFANKKRVRLIRADGHTEIVNVLRAIDDPQYDVPVYPGDKIVVKRRLF